MPLLLLGDVYMTIREEVKAIIKSDEINNDVKEIMEIFFEMIFEEISQPVQLVSKTFNMVITLREKLLLSKFRLFIDGVFINSEDRIKISQLFDSPKEKLEYIQILIKTLDDVETEAKVKYLINLTRALLVGIIEDKNDYYRMFNCVRTVLEQDLNFLSNNIESHELTNSVHVDFLFQAGLMYKSYDAGTMAKEVDKYSFTALAQMLDQCALKYDKDILKTAERIRNLKGTHHQGKTAGLSYRVVDSTLYLNENEKI